MTDYDELAEKYIAVWNETDDTRRGNLLAQVFTDDARYIDPLVDAVGRTAIAATVAGAQRQFPGFVFRLQGPVDAHHDQFRFRWELGPADGEAPVAGFDVATTDPDGRISMVLGFLDRVPVAP